MGEVKHKEILWEKQKNTNRTSTSTTRLARSTTVAMASKLMLRVSPVPRVQRTRTSPTNRHVTSTVAEAEQAFTSPVKRMGQTSMSSTRNIRILPDTLTGYVRSGTRKQRRWIARMCVYGALLIAIVLLAARWRRFHSREKDPSRVVMRASSALCPSPTHCTKKHKAVCRPEKLQMAALVGEAKRKLHAMRCSAHEPERVAILVPLRNRSAHAKRLRRVLGARLAHWKLDATIIFVEQSESGHFNVRDNGCLYPSLLSHAHTQPSHALSLSLSHSLSLSLLSAR